MSLPKSPRTVVTGAGGGFGRAIALEIARRGGRLVLGDVDLRQCKQTARLAMEQGAAEARALRCDVTKLSDVEALAAACPDGFDLLVNNAGVSSAGLVGALSLDDWRWTLNVDLWGVIHGCHVFVPLLREQGHGHVLNVAAAAGDDQRADDGRVQRRQGRGCVDFGDSRCGTGRDGDRGHRRLPDLLSHRDRRERAVRKRTNAQNRGAAHGPGRVRANHRAKSDSIRGKGRVLLHADG